MLQEPIWDFCNICEVILSRSNLTRTVKTNFYLTMSPKQKYVAVIWIHCTKGF